MGRGRRAATALAEPVVTDSSPVDAASEETAGPRAAAIKVRRAKRSGRKMKRRKAWAKTSRQKPAQVDTLPDSATTLSKDIIISQVLKKVS